ncbi:MAG: hypothetical protein ACKOBW_11475 [Planctomycetota bacterium]
MSHERTGVNERLHLPTWLLAAVLTSLTGYGIESPTTLTAAEPAREFLDALRSANYFDTALDYLDELASSPLTPASLKEVLTYERGLTLLKGASYQRDGALREKQLDEAQKALNEFIAQLPDHLLNTAAKGELGNVLMARAEFRLERVKRPSEAANRDKLTAEARELLGTAQKTYQTIEADLKAKLQGLPPIDEKKNPKEFERVEQMRMDYLQAQLMIPNVMMEIAETYPKGAKEGNDLLTAAAKAYGDVHTKYRQRLVGLRARFLQGNAFQRMGNLKEALSFYGELLELGDEPQDLHQLKTLVLKSACEAWMDESQKKYAEVIERGGKWIEKAYPSEMKSDDFMELRMTVAKASRAYSEQLKKEKPKDPLVNGLLVDARKLLAYVARFPGDYQKDAQRMLAELGGPAAATAGADQPLPKNFEEAKKAGKDALDAVQLAKANIENLTTQIKAEKDPEAKKKLQTELAEAERAVKNGNGDALRLFEIAQQLVEKDTPADEVSTVRYYLCFVNYSLQNYDEAAVLGDFVARRYPESVGARPCGRVAMYSFLKMYSDAKNDAQPKIDALLADFDLDQDKKLSTEEIEKMPENQRTALAGADVDKSGKIDHTELARLATRFESQSVVDMCNYIASQWPDQPEAQEAFGTLITFMIGEQELDRAQEYLNKIPEDSPQRATGELKLGQAVWAAYVYGMNAVRERKQALPPGTPAPADLASRETELKTYRDRAQKTLVDGVARMEKAGQVNVTFGTASLSLAQLYLDTDQAAQAVTLLEKPNVGPLALVTGNNEVASRPGFAEETYRTALRAYVSALAGASKDAAAAEALIKKAEEIMQGLKTSVGDGDDAQKKLFAIFVTLARDLEQQMKLSSDESKRNLGKGFETFLSQVRANSKALSELYWVASTFYGMGESYGTNASGEASADAKRFFGESAKTYEDILARSKAGTLKIEDTLVPQITLALAKTRREMGDYENAIKLFIQILEKSPMLLSVQLEAAKTYETWAERSSSEKYYVNAIQGSGDSKTGRSKIWGFNEVARITAGKPEFRDAFYEARYHVTLARYKYALAQKDAAKKKKELESAEKSIAATYQGYPNMDGNQTENKKSYREMYDGLAKAIQKSLGKKEAGITAYEIKIPTGGAAGATPGAPAGATAPAGTAPAAATPAKTAPAGAAPAKK